jgi:hypothetical protein
MKNVFCCLAPLVAPPTAFQTVLGPTRAAIDGLAQPGEVAMPITVKVSALKTPSPQEKPLRSELRFGTEDLKTFTSARILMNPSWPLCSMSFSLEDASGRYGTAEAASTDFSPSRKEPFSTVLNRDGIALRPGHLCGTIIRLDPLSYPRIRKPGTYRILGRYASAGVFAYQGTVSARPEDLPHLPAISWQGNVEANVIKVRVTPRRS